MIGLNKMIPQDKTLVTDTHVYFLNGPFSQWYPTEFTEGINGENRKFNCAEQFMLACKAFMFNDIEIFEKIMASKSPREQKELGRKVYNFHPDSWNELAQEFVYIGNLAKFSQNPKLKDYLLSSGNRHLVEGAHYDPIWGVGLAWNDPAILDSSNWRGTNWLGETLMQVRETLSHKEI
jgi:ribA/ribD-fused uncharacterized protein